jgi:hypothetical protein
MSPAVVRKCPAHKVELVERNGAPYCAWQAGHYPARWLEVDDAGVEKLTDGSTPGAAVQAWRESVGNATEIPPRPVKKLAAGVTGGGPPSGGKFLFGRALRPAATPAPRPPADDQVKQAAPPAAEQGGDAVSVPKCSNCGGNGHNVRTCSKERAGALAPAPRAQRKKPRASAALALTSSVREQLEQRREELLRVTEKIDQQLQAFELLEDIPKQHVAAARAVLEAAGADLGAKADARQQLALSKILAGVGAVLYAAELRSARKRGNVIDAAAAAIAADGDTQAA